MGNKPAEAAQDEDSDNPPDNRLQPGATFGLSDISAIFAFIFHFPTLSRFA